jgi:hypothetical protein
MNTREKRRWTPANNLTKKENNFVKYLVEHPKDSNTSAAVASYDTKNRLVAATIAKEVLQRPRVIAELAKYSSTAESNLIKLANVSTDYAMDGGKDGASYASVAEKVNNSILDRLHGKATIKTENATIAVTLNIDLAG